MYILKQKQSFEELDLDEFNGDVREILHNLKELHKFYSSVFSLKINYGQEDAILRIEIEMDQINLKVLISENKFVYLLHNDNVIFDEEDGNTRKLNERIGEIIYGKSELDKLLIESY